MNTTISPLITPKEAVLVLPAYNEGSRVGQPGEAPGDTFARSLDHYQAGMDAEFGSRGEVFVFNDGSADNTAEFARAHGVTVLEHADGQNHGRGRALSTAFDMLDSQADLIGYTDADGSYDWEAQRNLMELVSGGAHIANAYRLRGAEQHAGLMRRIGHPVLNQVCSILAPTGVKDPQAGAKWMNGEVAASLWHDAPEGWAADRYALNQAYRRGLIIKEMGFRIVSAEGSTVNPVKDALQMVKDSIVINRDNARHEGVVRKAAASVAVRGLDKSIALVKARQAA